MSSSTWEGGFLSSCPRSAVLSTNHCDHGRSAIGYCDRHSLAAWLHASPFSRFLPDPSCFCSGSLSPRLGLEPLAVFGLPFVMTEKILGLSELKERNPQNLFHLSQ